MSIKKTMTSVVALALTSHLAACNDGVAEPSEMAGDEIAALPVHVTTPERVELFATHSTTANLHSDADAPITARVEGEIVELMVEEGDFVQQGQVLARLDGDRLRIRLAQAKANLEKTSREYERFVNLQARGLVSTASVDAMKFDLDALKASHELSQLNYEYTFIRATISGVVSAREVKTGQHVTEGETVFRITDGTELLADLQIPQSEIGRFAAGHPATVLVDSMPEQKFLAKVARISPTIDARNGSFRATIVLDNKDGQLVPGMFGRIEIAYEKHTDAIVVPVDAIVEEDNTSVVYVVEGNAAVRRLITTGIEENGRIEITNGLSGDEQVIVTGQNGLRDGSKVLASISLARHDAG